MKSYVLDTNVLIQAPHALMSFEDNVIVLPVVVLEELDRLKGEEGERGAHARSVIRTLDALRATDPWSRESLCPVADRCASR